ncbi:MAG: hypothetical protein HKL80_08915 [Acidimicrobiales bacterium]|nr:hypothetical protein [Acidimicrobiales bacterium]
MGILRRIVGEKRAYINFFILFCTVLCVTAGLTGISFAGSSNPTSGGYFVPLTPARIINSNCSEGLDPLTNDRIQTFQVESAPSYPSCPSSGAPSIMLPATLSAHGPATLYADTLA